MTPNKLITIACVNQTVHWFIFGIIIPVLTLLQLDKGLDYFQIGITIALYSAMTVLLELPTGGLADAIGRKTVYMISLGITCLSVIILLFAQSFMGIAAGFAVMGTGRALSSGSLDAWFVDEFYKIDSRDNLQPALAKIGFFIPLGLGAGCLTGGFLPMLFAEATTHIPGFTIYSANLLAVGFMIIIQFFLTFVLIKEERPGETHASLLDGFRQFPVILNTSIRFGIKNRLIFILLLTSLAWGFAISGLELLWQPHVRDIAQIESQTWIYGVLATGYFISSSLGNLIVIKVCKIYQNNYRKILFFTRLIMGVMLVILAFQNGLQGFTLFYWTLFIFNGMTNSPHAALFNSEIPSDKRSTLLSFESLFLQAGGLTGSLLMGYLSYIFTIQAAWLFGAVILIVSSLGYAWLPESGHTEKAHSTSRSVQVKA